MSTVALSRSADCRFYGVVEGTVAKNIDPDGLGRVRVRFPWLDGKLVSEWCRVAQPYAGGGYGAYFIPEKDDEVLVACPHGDLRFATVIGGLYNGVDKPARAKSEDLDQKMIRTKGGHELVLEDKGDAEGARLTTKEGHRVELNDDTGQIVVKTSSGQESIVLDADSKKLTVTAGGASITVDTTSGTITVKTSGAVEVDATRIRLGGDGALVLFQELLTTFNTHTHVAAGFGSPTAPPVPLLLPTAATKTTGAA